MTVDMTRGGLFCLFTVTHNWSRERLDKIRLTYLYNTNDAAITLRRMCKSITKSIKHEAFLFDVLRVWRAYGVIQNALFNNQREIDSVIFSVLSRITKIWLPDFVIPLYGVQNGDV